MKTEDWLMFLKTDGSNMIVYNGSISHIHMLRFLASHLQKKRAHTHSHSHISLCIFFPIPFLIFCIQCLFSPATTLIAIALRHYIYILTFMFTFFLLFFSFNKCLDSIVVTFIYEQLNIQERLSNIKEKKSYFWFQE